MNIKKAVFLGIVFGFFFLGALAMQRALPEAKEQRIYSAIKPYIPYKLEKYVGGLKIVDTRDGRVEKPDAASVYHRLDELEKEWGAHHLQVVNNSVVVLGDHNQSVVKIFIETQKERDWLKSYFGI